MNTEELQHLMEMMRGAWDSEQMVSITMKGVTRDEYVEKLITLANSSKYLTPELNMFVGELLAVLRGATTPLPPSPAEPHSAQDLYNKAGTLGTHTYEEERGKSGSFDSQVYQAHLGAAFLDVGTIWMLNKNYTRDEEFINESNK